MRHQPFLLHGLHHFPIQPDRLSQVLCAALLDERHDPLAEAVDQLPAGVGLGEEARREGAEGAGAGEAPFVEEVGAAGLGGEGEGGVWRVGGAC